MDQPTNYEPSASTTRLQDQALHSADRRIVETPLELHNRGLDLNSKRLGLNGSQVLLNAELLELYRRQHALNDEQLKLDSEQLELTALSARTSAIPVVDAPTDDSTIEQLLALIADMPTDLILSCPPIAALPSLLGAALPAARPTAAQEGKRPASTNESPESPVAPKRYRGDGQITSDDSTTGSSLTTCRSLSEGATVERLLVAIEPSVIFDLAFASAMYHRAHGCPLVPPGVKPRAFVTELVKLDGLEHWAKNSAALAGLNVLRRRDLDAETLRLDVLQQLGLAEDLRAVVLGPRLCCVLVKICGMSIDQMTGPVISSAFFEVTGLHLHSLNVVTEEGVRQMTAKSICRALKKWICNHSKLLAKNSGMEKSLAEAVECNSFYEGKCSGGDSDGLVAKRMLKSNKYHSQAFLGIQEANLRELYKRLADIASKDTGTHAKECLEQLSIDLWNRPSST
ncbi:hypothetical protein GGI03_003253 [Coemansia sp. RSA 2337]|nr:hypothetical protein GGI03_003253 [Coemansia sp. RSA 2337]